MTPILKTTAAGTVLLRNATVPACLLPPDAARNAHPAPQGDALGRVDLLIEKGRLAAITTPGGCPAEVHPSHDLDGGLVLPAFVDMHTHLDKGHIWSRQPNPDGTFQGAMAAVSADRPAHWTAEDVTRRMDFALRAAYSHGTAAIRTHIDSIPPQDGISWPVFAEMRAAWRDRITLQGVALFGLDLLTRAPDFLTGLVTRLAKIEGVLGAVIVPAPDLDDLLDRLFIAAKEHGLDLDFHVDETGTPSVNTLRAVAAAVLRHRFQGRIVCGHCCSLAVLPDDDADRTMDLVAEAGIGIVSLPLCNMYLQDRQPGRTPRWRGVTLLHELNQRGIPVALASDNTRDPFHAYGDLDMVEVFSAATRTLQLDHPHADWVRTVTTTPADLMRCPQSGCFQEGSAADFVLFAARNWNELLARPSGPREVLRHGASLRLDPPDYRELDSLLIPQS